MPSLRRIAPLLLLALSFSLSGYTLEKLQSLSTSGIAAKSATVYISNCSMANIRDGAGTDHKVLSTLKSGQALTLLSTADGWSRVKMPNGKTGYVANWLVNQTTDTTAAKYAVVECSAQNLRSGPGTDSSVQSVLKKGAKVEVLGKTGSWYKVRYNGKTGYMASWLMKSATSKDDDKKSDDKKSDDKKNDSDASTASGIAKKIVGEARDQLGTKRYQKAITEYGNLACAAYVSGVLKDSGAIKGNGSLNTVGLRTALQKQGWKKVSLSKIQPGDVVFWGPYNGGKHGHVGIIEGKHGGTWYTCDNSSAKRVPVKRPLNTSRTIICVLRHP